MRRGFGALLRRRCLALGLAMVIAALASLAALGLAGFAGAFIAAAALTGSAGSLALIVAQPAWIGFFALARTLGRYADRLIGHDVTLRLMADLRNKLFRDFIPLAPARLAGWRSGDLLARITADIDALEAFTVRVLLPFAGAGAAVLAALFCFFWLDVRIGAVVAVGCGIAGGWLPWRQGRRAENAARQVPELEAELRSILVDGIEGLADLTSAGAVGRYRQKAALHSLKLVALREELHLKAQQAELWAGLWAKGSFVVVLWLALEGVAAGRLGGVEAALLCFATLAVFEPVASLASAWQHLARVSASASRISQVAHTAPAVTAPGSPQPVPKRYDFCLDRVSFTYDQRQEPALQDLSLSLPQGHKLALLGENGSGKTTLSGLLLRLYDPQQGVVRFGGVDLRHIRPEDLWQHVAYLPQRPDLFEGSLADNLRIAQAGADEAALWRALQAVDLESMARQRQGLETQIGQGGVLLSGGQGRRLALARLLLTSASVWVLDEATESVDRHTESLLIDAILADPRRTVVFITHRHTALDRFDRVLFLKQGQLHPAP